MDSHNLLWKDRHVFVLYKDFRLIYYWSGLSIHFGLFGSFICQFDSVSLWNDDLFYVFNPCVNVIGVSFRCFHFIFKLSFLVIWLNHYHSLLMMRTVEGHFLPSSLAYVASYTNAKSCFTFCHCFIFVFQNVNQKSFKINLIYFCILILL